MTRDQLQKQLGTTFSFPRNRGPNPPSVETPAAALPPWNGCAEWVFDHFQVGDFFELDFAGASSKLEPQLHCVLTGLVMHTHSVPLLLIPLLKEAQPEADRRGQRIISPSSQVQSHRFNTGDPVKFRFQHKYISCNSGDILMLKKKNTI